MVAAEGFVVCCYWLCGMVFQFVLGGASWNVIVYICLGGEVCMESNRMIIPEFWSKVSE
jgi:hypothetical protein